MDKSQIVRRIIQNLQKELEQAMDAAQQAHDGATHEQSKAETQYDTLGLEHAYLAEGQSRRIEDIKRQIVDLDNWQPADFSEDDEIYLGALITLTSPSQPLSQTLNVFLVPAGGGHTINGIQIITPQTPLGEALLGLTVEEEAQLANGQKYLITHLT